MKLFYSMVAGIAALFVLANDAQEGLKVAAVYGIMAALSYLLLTRKVMV